MGQALGLFVSAPICALFDRIVPNHKGLASMTTDELPLLHRPTKLSDNQLFALICKSYVLRN
jgi:hypothetical protein